MAEYYDKEQLLDHLDYLNNELPLITESEWDIAKGWDMVIDEIRKYPTEDVQPVVHCKDCIRRPHYDPPDSDCNSDLEFPDDWNSLCPYYCEDNWYSEMPQDDWFCNFGKRTDGEP